VSATPSTSSSAPCVRSLVIGASLITLGVTLLRLGLELGHAPAWLASAEGGGGTALLGISWLPLLFGPLFALRLRPQVESAKALFKPLAKSLILYGLGARLPVVLVTIPAVLLDWNVHYALFPPFADTDAKKLLAAAVVQLVGWVFVWTLGAGLIAGYAALALRRRETAPAM
jgi:hypothetical protein